MLKRKMSFTNELKIRSNDEPNENKVIEGYFLKFNNQTELWRGFFEEIDSNALKNVFSSNFDVKCLFNHDAGSVLGSRDNKTLKMQIDEIGLWASVEVNESDTEALNIYQRVKRGDITTCSFGFSVNEESYVNNDDGSVLCRLLDINLFEVSIVAFPAYDNTGVSARKKIFEEERNLNVEKIRKGVLDKYV